MGHAIDMFTTTSPHDHATASIHMAQQHLDSRCVLLPAPWLEKGTIGFEKGINEWSLGVLIDTYLSGLHGKEHIRRYCQDLERINIVTMVKQAVEQGKRPVTRTL